MEKYLLFKDSWRAPALCQVLTNGFTVKDMYVLGTHAVHTGFTQTRNRYDHN